MARKSLRQQLKKKTIWSREKQTNLQWNHHYPTMPDLNIQACLYIVAFIRETNAKNAKHQNIRQLSWIVTDFNTGYFQRDVVPTKLIWMKSLNLHFTSWLISITHTELVNPSKITKIAIISGSGKINAFKNQFWTEMNGHRGMNVIQMGQKYQNTTRRFNDSHEHIPHDTTQHSTTTTNN